MLCGKAVEDEPAIPAAVINGADFSPPLGTQIIGCNYGDVYQGQMLEEIY